MEKSHCCGQPTHNALKSIKSAIIQGSQRPKPKGDFSLLRSLIHSYPFFIALLFFQSSVPNITLPHPLFYKDKAEKGSNLQPPSILDVRVTLISACCQKILLAQEKIVNYFGSNNFTTKLVQMYDTMAIYQMHV